MENTYESIVLGTAAKDGRVFTSEEETTFRMFHRIYSTFFLKYILKNPEIYSTFSLSDTFCDLRSGDLNKQSVF